MIKITDEAITKLLDELRERLGARLRVDFKPGPPVSTADVDLEGNDFETLLHSSDLLVLNGRPVLAYIRDHSFVEAPYSPKNCNKVHFSVCKTIYDMKLKGRFKSRYRATHSVSNMYKIDVAKKGHKSNELEINLYPCQHCLALLEYQGFDITDPKNEKRVALMAFDAEQAHKILQDRLEVHRQEFLQLRPATIGTGYPIHWPAISYSFRHEKGFRCEICGVQGSKITDTHHMNGDKSDVEPENLQCLCKLCHSEKHSHYNVSKEIEALIKRKRKWWRRLLR